MTTATTPRGAATGAGEHTLTPKQSRFVEEYLIDLNATQAYIRAGYSAKTAEKNAARLMGNEGVAAAIAAKRAEISAKTGATVQGIVERLWAIGNSDVGELFNDNGGLKNPQELTKEQRIALASVKVNSYTPPGEDAQTEWTKEVKFWDKRAALVDLLRHLGGMPKEAPDVNVTVNVEMPPIEALHEKLAKLTGEA